MKGPGNNDAFAFGSGATMTGRHQAYMNEPMMLHGSWCGGCSQAETLGINHHAMRNSGFAPSPPGPKGPPRGVRGPPRGPSADEYNKFADMFEKSVNKMGKDLGADVYNFRFPGPKQPNMWNNFVNGLKNAFKGPKEFGEVGYYY